MLESAAVAAFYCFAHWVQVHPLVVVARSRARVFDWFHGRLIADPGVPSWWPMFCLTTTSWQRRISRALGFSRLQPDEPGDRAGEGISSSHQDICAGGVSGGEECDGRGDFAGSFEHLERPTARQASTREHVRVHWQMLRWAAQRQRKSCCPGAAHCRRCGLTAAGSYPKEYRRRKCERSDAAVRPTWQHSLHRGSG